MMKIFQDEILPASALLKKKPKTTKDNRSQTALKPFENFLFNLQKLYSWLSQPKIWQFVSSRFAPVCKFLCRGILWSPFSREKRS